MRATIALASIPLPVFGFAWILKPLPEKPIVPTPVIAEGVRKVDMDVRTFAIRWSPVSYLAPAVMIQPVVEERISEPPMAKVQQPRTIRRASLDLCARHRMRKVWYGKRWRCTRS
jgi:hypothetical protein